MPDEVKAAVQEMAQGMSADEKVLTFMQGAKYALECVKNEKKGQEAKGE